MCERNFTLSIERANQVWATDVCYIPMAKGFMYLVAIMDRHSRRVLSRRLSNAPDTDFWFVERLWRSVKYEEVYLRAYETPAELRRGLTRYFDFYNARRRHSALDRRTLDAVYFGQVTRERAA